jgi:peroxiredoxin Q/BCP
MSAFVAQTRWPAQQESFRFSVRETAQDGPHSKQVPTLRGTQTDKRCRHGRREIDMSLIEPGRKAPAFTLKDQSGNTHRLSDYAGRPLVLYFYPKDDTPGCTQETCDFRDNLPRFTNSKAAVLGVSILDEKSKAKFAAKHDVNFPLLADADHAVAEKYGVWQEKSRYGRKYMGIARTTYLIGADGKIVRRWDNVKVPNHVDQVYEAVQSLTP